MRVLHLPLNVASQISVSVLALREIGLHAQGLVVRTSHLQEQAGVESIFPPKSSPWAFFIGQSIYGVITLIRWLVWAEVLHWHFGSDGLSQRLLLLLARVMGKRQVVEFWGTDIRIPQIEARDNPHYAAVMHVQEYRSSESPMKSFGRQRIFARYCPAFFCSIGLREFIHPRLQPRVIRVSQRVDCRKLIPNYPDPGKRVPVIAHAPSAPEIKGTSRIIAAVEELKCSQVFEFTLIQGLPHDQAIQKISECDIFIDQLRYGHHGLASIEAMALGKPVIAYIKPSMRRQYPLDLPIVVADPTDITSVLSGLLQDGERRRCLGQAGREYVMRNHHSLVVARTLAQLYVTCFERRN